MSCPVKSTTRVTRTNATKSKKWTCQVNLLSSVSLIAKSSILIDLSQWETPRIHLGTLQKNTGSCELSVLPLNCDVLLFNIFLKIWASETSANNFSTFTSPEKFDWFDHVFQCSTFWPPVFAFVSLTLAWPPFWGLTPHRPDLSEIGIRPQSRCPWLQIGHDEEHGSFLWPPEIQALHVLKSIHVSIAVYKCEGNGWAAYFCPRILGIQARNSHAT